MHHRKVFFKNLHLINLRIGLFICLYGCLWYTMDIQSNFIIGNIFELMLEYKQFKLI